MSYEDQGQPPGNDPYAYQDPSAYQSSEGYAGYESQAYENQSNDSPSYQEQAPVPTQQHQRSRLEQLQRLQSGIPGFDQIVNGGLIRDRVYLLSGPAGAGKTIFSSQFLYNGLTKFGGLVL